MKALLISAVYKDRKPVLKFYEPKTNRIILVDDTTGYNAHFYTNPSEIQEMRNTMGVENVEEVEMFDVVRDDFRPLCKVTVNNPMVKYDMKEAGRGWETDIKFYQDYLYDNGYIVGTWYELDNEKITPIKDNKSSFDLSNIDMDNVVDTAKFTKQLEKWANLLGQEIPHIKRLAFDIEVESTVGLPDPATAQNRVTAISFHGDGIKKVFTLRRPEIPMGDEDKNKDYELVWYDDEAKLLEDALQIIDSYPVVLTYNGDMFDMPYLYNRANVLGLSYNPFKMMARKATLNNAVHIDLYGVFSNRSLKIYAFNAKYVEEGLDPVSQAMLGEGKTEYEGNLNDIPLYLLSKYCYNDSRLTYELSHFNNNLVMNLLIILCRIGNMPIDDISRLSISNWIKSMLYFEHRVNNQLIPRSSDFPQIEASTKADIKDKQYQGATVLEPTKGIHFGVTVLDFASLYPSIIKTRNVSYETICCPHDKCKSNTIPNTKHWSCTKKQGIVSLLIGSLKELRVNHFKPRAKDKTKSQEFRDINDTIAQALKVFLNASYGVIGFNQFPLFFLPTAESVTAIGRDIISQTIEAAKSKELPVLYGDTDSVTGNTPILYMNNNGHKKIIPIESLHVDTESSKLYKCGGKVWSDKGFTDIKYVYKHKVKKTGYRIVTRKSFIECTEDHSLVIDGKETKPSELNVGDKLNLIPYTTTSKYEIDNDLSWLFGLFLAEGTCGIYPNCKKNHWAIINNDIEILKKCQKIMLKCLGFKTKILDTMKSSSVYKLVPVENHVIVIDYFKSHCYKNNTKICPSIVLESNIENKNNFIRGLMDGDGNKTQTELSQIHHSLLAGYTSILNELGINYTLDTRQDKTNVIRIRNVKNPRSEDDVIKNITKYEIDDYVYDLETKNHHFCGGIGNVLLHNSIFVYQPSQEQIDYLIEFCRSHYAIDLEVDKVYKYLVLSDRKKNYFGVKSDNSLDIKGLAGKKSNTPPYLRRLFDDILEKLKVIEIPSDFPPVKKEVEHLTKTVIENFDKIPLEQLALNVLINKEPHEYKVKPQVLKAAEQLPDKPQKGQFVQFVKTWKKPNVMPIQIASQQDIDKKKYMEGLESVMEQIFEPLDISVDAFMGYGKQTTLTQW